MMLRFASSASYAVWLTGRRMMRSFLKQCMMRSFLKQMGP